MSQPVSQLVTPESFRTVSPLTQCGEFPPDTKGTNDANYIDTGTLPAQMLTESQYTYSGYRDICTTGPTSPHDFLRLALEGDS